MQGKAVLLNDGISKLQQNKAYRNNQPTTNHYTTLTYTGQKNTISLPQHHRGVQTASITGVVGSVIAVQRDKDAGFVVLSDHHRDVEVGVVAVVDAAEEEVAMEIAGVHVELQMLVVEVQRPQGENHGLQHTLRP